MNHGYCINCWWWEEASLGFGRCYMHNSDEEKYIMTEESSYCSDYINHKKEKGSLNDFIKNIEK